MLPDDDTGRSPIRFSLLELITFIVLITVAQGTLTAMVDYGHANRNPKQVDISIEKLITTADGKSAARTGPGQAVIFSISITLALLGSAWGVWAAKSFSALTSAQRAGLMALGLIWVSVLPVAIVLLVALPFLLIERGVLVIPVLVGSWAIVVAANTVPVKAALRARREKIKQDELDRLGPLPPLPGAPVNHVDDESDGPDPDSAP